jgi:threonyl-tRNA synthetase
VDFSMPERFDLTFVGADGHEHRPVMIHRAIFGSLERFLGILIEHYGGNFPLWLAPVQVAILPIGADHVAWARDVCCILNQAGIRTELDESDEKIARKIRNSEMQKIPCMLIIGDREKEARSAALRRHQKGDVGQKSIEDIVMDLKKEIGEKRLSP